MRQLPVGPVTYLLTDIEGSTRKWERHPEAMQAALERHDDLLREAIERHGGIVFKTVGDAFYAVFASAGQALEAAVAVQQALRSHDWTQIDGLSVRMAVHTGETQVRANDYFGPELNRVARLLAAGHGGQVLVSEAAAAITEERLPGGMGLRPLGRHRLRDVQKAATVYQLTHADIESEFPELKSLSRGSESLPPQFTSFIGRDRELVELHRLASRTRLLTITGAGGCGKTRLLVKLGEALLDEFPDGAWFVGLASLAVAELVPDTVARSLGIGPEAGQPILNTLLAALGSKRLVLLLDNCEHVLGACQALTIEVLQTCQNVSVVTTSREVLNIAGETSWPVPPLALGDPRASLTELETCESVVLFVDRARSVRPDFALTPDNTAAVAEICARLDGIPLAIELAAARMRVLSVDDITARLSDRFALLTGGSRTALPRQQTLRALIDWSHDLLNESEKGLLRRLSVFAGGWTLEAAESVCSGGPIAANGVLDVLTSLVEKSIVMRDENPDGGVRYRMLESIRAYAMENLIAAGETPAVEKAHATFYLAFAAKGSRELIGPNQLRWFDWFEQDHDNFRAAWRVQTGRGRDHLNPAAAGAFGLAWFWYVHGHVREADEWTSTLLPLRDALAEVARLQLLIAAAGTTFVLDRYEEARKLCQEGLDLARRWKLPEFEPWYLYLLGYSAVRRGQAREAQRLAVEHLLAARATKDRWHMAMAHQLMGHVAAFDGDGNEADRHYAEALAIQREIKDTRGIGLSLYYRGTTKLHAGNWSESRTLLLASLEAFEILSDRIHQSDVLAKLAGAAVAGGDVVSAGLFAREALSTRRDIGDRRGIAVCLATYAEVTALSPGNAEHAARILGAASALGEATGVPSPPERAQVDAVGSGLRNALGDERFALAWTEGRRMAPEEAINSALGQ